MIRKKNKLTKYTTMIATVATTVLAITALITVYITVSAWKEEREANRPYFTFQDSPEVVDYESPEFEIKFTNVGEHPAIRLWSKSIVINADLKSKPIAIDEYALVNDIPKNASATLVIESDTLKKQTAEGTVSPIFVVIVLRYEDPIIDEQFEQLLYIKWNGMEDGKLLGTTHAEEEEKQKINKYLKQHRINF
ncbi:MAG: hypothetical protein GX207_00360 [Peptococcaceae bacterium]|nr:hypothetical protein [Peptococcaceae bacterium]